MVWRIATRTTTTRNFALFDHGRRCSKRRVRTGKDRWALLGEVLTMRACRTSCVKPRDSPHPRERAFQRYGHCYHQRPRNVRQITAGAACRVCELDNAKLLYVATRPAIRVRRLRPEGESRDVPAARATGLQACSGHGRRGSCDRAGDKQAKHHPTKWVDPYAAICTRQAWRISFAVED